MTEIPRNIERRPDSSGVSAIRAFPREWGEPPPPGAVRKAWIKSCIREGEERRAKGESVPWLKEIR